MLRYSKGPRVNVPTTPLAPALRFALPYWPRLMIVLVLSLLSTLLALYVPYLFKDLIDRALVGRDFARLVRLVGLFVGASLVSFMLNVVSGLVYTRVSANILFDMRLAVYRHLQRLSPRFYARTKLGEIVSRLNNDIGELQRVTAEVILAWVGNLLFLAGTVVMMGWLDLSLFLVALVTLPFSIAAMVHFRRRLGDRVNRMRERSSDIGSFLIETLQGIELTVRSNAQEREVARFRAKNDAFVDALMEMQRFSYLSGGIPGLILTAGTALVFLYGGWKVIEGGLTLGTLVAFLGYQMRLLSPIQGLMGLYASLATARVSFGRVQQLFDARPDVHEDRRPVAADEIRGDVTFDHVTLTFDRVAPVLRDVTFGVSAGETIAIVGPSGSGKSTIADLLLRLLDPDSGAVKLDGHDLKTLCLTDVRRHVVLVEHNPFLFHASIRENLRYANPTASDAEVAAAAAAAGLESFIADLPEGYETMVGERGLALSTGERQRVALARAFLTRPAVLVLDEATASLDPTTEHHVLTAFDTLIHGRTGIVISHRLDLAARADRVVVLDAARVVEDGPPKELIRKGGAFARLFAESSRTGSTASKVATTASHARDAQRGP